MIPGLNIDFSFVELVPDLPLLTVVDISAPPLDGNSEIYAPLIARGKVTLYTSETNNKDRDNLVVRLGPPHQVFPVIVGDGNAAATTESLFPQNLNLTSRFSGLPEIEQPVGIDTVQTHRLDDLISDDEIDFLKMDAQGRELLILDGAHRLASTALAVHSKVGFVPVYLDQPLFADIDIRLRSLGFQFHTFNEFGARPYRPLRAVENGDGGLRQLLWSDATYVPDVTQLDQYSNQRLLKLAVILHDFYKSVDLVLHVLTYVRDRGEPKPFHDYCTRIGLG